MDGEFFQGIDGESCLFVHTHCEFSSLAVVGKGIVFLVRDLLVCQASAYGLGHNACPWVVVQIQHCALFIQLLVVAVSHLLARILISILRADDVTVNIVRIGRRLVEERVILVRHSKCVLRGLAVLGLLKVVDNES